MADRLPESNIIMEALHSTAIKFRGGCRPCALEAVQRAAEDLRATMTEKEGILRLQSSGRWAVCRPGRDPVEIMSGELFRVEVDGDLRLTRMEEVWGEGYFSIDLLTSP